MRCYHTRSITVTKENRLFQGCVYPTRSGKQQVEFKLVAQRVEENAKVRMRSCLEVEGAGSRECAMGRQGRLKIDRHDRSEAEAE
eukprot:410230-Hanusia_phi.AAC.1